MIETSEPADNTVSASDVYKRQVQSEANKDLTGKALWTRALMKFRSWIPGLVQPRFKNLTYDEDTEEFDVGRYRIFMDEWLRSGTIGARFKSFRDLAFEVALNLPIVSRLKGDLAVYKKGGINQRVLKIKYEEFMSRPENAHLRGKVKIEDFIEFRAAKLTGMAKEISTILTLLVLASFVKAMVPDDDEEYIKRFLAKSSYRTLNRALLEATFFTDPMSVDTIISSPSADWGTIVNLYRWVGNTLDETRDLVTPDEDIAWGYIQKKGAGGKWFNKSPKDKTVMLQRTKGLVPLLGQVLTFLDVFDEDVK